MLSAAASKELAKHLGEISGSKCPEASFHKPGYYVAPSFLDLHEIPYTIVTQEPGDLMVINNGVFHQVTNAGPNVAAAINFDVTSHIGKLNVDTCNCSSGRDENGEVSYNARAKIPAVGKFFCSPCEEYNFSTKDELERHNRENHPQEKPKTTCQICSAQYETFAGLRVHFATKHLGEKRQCKRCLKEFQKTNIARHEKFCGAAKIQCLGCEKFISAITKHRCKKRRKKNNFL